MTVKAYLQQAYMLDRKIKLDKDKEAAMRSAIYGKGITYDSDGSQHTAPADNSTDRAIVEVMDYQRRINAEICELVEKRIEIERVINSVPDDIQRDVLSRRYLLYQDWESHYNKYTGEYIKGIAEELGYEVRQIYRFHGRALAYIQKNMSVNVSKIYAMI